MKLEVSNPTHQINLRMDLKVLKSIDSRKVFLNALIKFHNAKGKIVTRGDVIEEMVNNGLCGLEIIDLVESYQYGIKETTLSNELFIENMKMFFEKYENGVALEELAEVFYHNLDTSIPLEEFIQVELTTLFLNQLDFNLFKIYRREFLNVLFDAFYVEIKNNHVVFKEYNEALCKVTFGLMDIINEKIKNCGIDV